MRRTRRFLTANVTNPFAGLLPGSTINGATVQRQQLLRPFPEFGTFAIEEYNGSDRYDAATLQIEKRFRSGNSLTAQYTRSSLHDKLNYLNPQDGVLEDRVSPNDRPNRFSIGTSLRLPFGRQRAVGQGLEPGASTRSLGGWQMSGTYQYQDGFPLSWASVYYDACVRQPGDAWSRTSARRSAAASPGSTCRRGTSRASTSTTRRCRPTAWTIPVKQRADQRIQLDNNVRYFPSTLPNVRTDNLHLLDIGLYKNFSLPRGMKLQFRMEAINALNYTVLWNPDTNPRNSTFGFINQDRNNPRDLQIGAAVHVLTLEVGGPEADGGWTETATCVCPTSDSNLHPPAIIGPTNADAGPRAAPNRSSRSSAP